MPLSPSRVFMVVALNRQTAIGKRNMLPFQFFVCLVFVCLVVDIFLITGAL